ncbi:serum paraoxonase/arylesterase 2-like [Denticeps clupeoides]|uniref:Paraoxonase n=1 Tax=Denticeps clupeoides TaxID=299321 RepID=A0AAY4AZX4_9TELE|nr:serum paraoxonase/arylesterase 2-like [Denticeps clupeoides]
MGKLKILSYVVAALAVFLGQRIYRLRNVSLATRELIQNHLPNCQVLKGLDYGSEDIAILPNGLALISSGLKYPGMPRYSDDPGKIFILDLFDSKLKPVELRISRGFDLDSFNPHGISVYLDDADGTVHLFVVNHVQHPNYHQSQVEIFKFIEDEKALEHVKTIKHELLHSVNDIVAVGVESFYATNDEYFTHLIMRMISPLFSFAWSDVVFYSPEEVKVVAEGFYSANGINISPDKKYIYVADVVDHKVHVLKTNDNINLVPVKAVDVGSLVDNIDVDPDTGDLWLGCHPNGWKLFKNDPQDPPGSEILKIENILSEQPTVKQVYADDGSVLIGSTIAARYEEKLLIGTIYHKTLCCDVEAV